MSERKRSERMKKACWNFMMFRTFCNSFFLLAFCSFNRILSFYFFSAEFIFAI